MNSYDALVADLLKHIAGTDPDFANAFRRRDAQMPDGQDGRR